MSVDCDKKKERAIKELSDYMDLLDDKKAKKLAYWLIDYVRMLKAEETFDSRKLVRYKRGAIVKVHLGYRIGSEEGGLHYAIVLDSENKLSDKTVTVIPLTSVKDGTDLTKLHHSKLHLGNEVFILLYSKAKNNLFELQERKKEIDKAECIDAKKNDIMLSEFDKCISDTEKVIKEIQKMKKGSIALVGQITTVSKQRIFDPVYSRDVLTSIRVSEDTLGSIDKKINELYGKKLHIK